MVASFAVKVDLEVAAVFAIDFTPGRRCWDNSGRLFDGVHEGSTAPVTCSGSSRFVAVAELSWSCCVTSQCAGQRRSFPTDASAVTTTFKAVCTLRPGLLFAVSALSACSVSPVMILARNAARTLALLGSIAKSMPSIVGQLASLLNGTLKPPRSRYDYSGDDVRHSLKRCLPPRKQMAP